MDIKDVLLVLDADKHNEAAAVIACRLALENDAFIHTRCVVPWSPSAAECFAIGAAADRDVLDRADRKASAIVSDVRLALLHAGGSPEAVKDCTPVDETEARFVIPSQAQSCDLVVMAHGPLQRAQQRELAGETILSGTPCLFVPTESESVDQFDTVVIAWNGTAEAKRAIDASLPILKRASQVYLAVIDDPVDLDENNDERAMAARLKRRGISCATGRISRHRAQAGNALLALCDDQRADLLVMGAFGHSRRWEALVGGTSHVALERTKVPLLMAS